MVFNATFNNISVISWQSVLLVEEDGVPGESVGSRTSKEQFDDTKSVIISLYQRRQTIQWTNEKGEKDKQ